MGSARNSPLAAAVLLGVLIWPALGDGCPDDPDTDLCDTTTMTTTTSTVTTTPMVPMCADDDAHAVRAAQARGFTIGGCADLHMFCEHPELGGFVQATCPETCGLCCADDDAYAVELAQGVGVTIGGCADVHMFCEHPMYGNIVQATCPETCGLCCADDDAYAVELAQGLGLTIGGCADVQMFCDHPGYGSTVQATCPATCDSCTGGGGMVQCGHGGTDTECKHCSGSDPMRCESQDCQWNPAGPYEEKCEPIGGRRLADRNDLNAGGLDGIQELTVVAPQTHAAAAEVMQKIEEFSISDTSFLIP